MSAGARAILRAGLRSPAGRGGMAVLGVAVSAFLVTTLLASYRGLAAGVVAYAGQDGIDLWVAPRGTDNLIRSSSVMDAGAVRRIRALPGIRAAGGVLRGFATATAPGDGTPEITLLVLAFEAPDGPGGPPRWWAGRAPSGPAEAALDRAAAWRLGVGIGDRVQLNGREFEVAGLTAGTNLIATQLAFLDLAGARAILGFAGLSFLAVATESAPAEVARRIRLEEPAVEAIETPAFTRRNLEEVGAGFRPMQLLVSGTGVAAAAVLVMLLVQSLVADRRSELAVLLALGAPVLAVGRALVWNIVLLAAFGVLAGAGLTAALAVVAARWMPTLELVVLWMDLAAVALLVLAAAVAAAAVPLARLRSIEPAEAFRP